MKIAITGHRPSKLGNDYDLRSPLIKRIKTMIMDFITSNFPGIPIIFISGVALGIDTLFAEIAIERGDILHVYIPFKGQHLAWPKGSQDRYMDILRYAAEIHICDTGKICYSFDEYLAEPHTAYSAAKMQIRNEHMANDCEHAIAVWDGTKGGTYNCVQYLNHINKPIHRINPNHLEIEY